MKCLIIATRSKEFRETVLIAESYRKLHVENCNNGTVQGIFGALGDM